MPTFIFRHRLTDAVIATLDADNARKAVQTLVRAGTSLANADLSGLNLSGANLEGGVFTNANCKGTIFDGAVLRGANFTNAIMTGSSMIDVLAHKMTLTGAEVTNLTQLKRD